MLDKHLNADNIARITKAENEFQKLSETRSDAFASIQAQKLDQYATLISHFKPLWTKENKTDSNNFKRQIGIDTRTALQNDCGVSKANAKVLYEKGVQFIAKYSDDIPTQATPDSVIDVFAQMNIKSQNDLKKSVSEEKDVDLAEVLARKLFGRVKTQKIKLDDGTTKEEEVYVPTDLKADEWLKVWETLNDKKREREEHDKSSAKTQKEVAEKNKQAEDIMSAIAS